MRLAVSLCHPPFLAQASPYSPVHLLHSHMLLTRISLFTQSKQTRSHKGRGLGPVLELRGLGPVLLLALAPELGPGPAPVLVRVPEPGLGLGLGLELAPVLVLVLGQGQGQVLAPVRVLERE